MVINTKINKKESKELKNKVYVIYYYPPYVTLTIDDDILRFFGWARDKWTIIDEKGQEYEISAILLFYGLPVNKRRLEKLKSIKNDEFLELYYELSLIDVYTGLTNYSKKDIKKLTKKLFEIKGKPIKVKEIGDLELDFRDSLERAYSYHLRIRELNTIYGKVITHKKSIFSKGLKFPSLSFDRENLRKFVGISVIVIILIIFVAIIYFIYMGFGVVKNFEQTFVQTYLQAYNETFDIINPLG